ncbi:hypothetical protein Bpfe_005788 [Biomphalaria pfeifferi]|uniref:Uncharacterized protein n=1 Tax=Biomphalaria pfeifferi TaxID=112525 RepID=A0AAD8FIT2_BIOPF|nr:hypothetical protein Bpfe_005788 [Biomphalaria pfeifferi]
MASPWKQDENETTISISWRVSHRQRTQQMNSQVLTFLCLRGKTSIAHGDRKSKESYNTDKKFCGSKELTPLQTGKKMKEKLRKHQCFVPREITRIYKSPKKFDPSIVS